jgi:ribA/ribD-fused uncharacterized protein
MTISSFKGNYDFLSNFYLCPMSFNGTIYGSSEAAFQAQKTFDYTIREIFSTLSPKLSKRLGNAIRCRPDWDTIKVKLMEEIVREKFTQNLDLAKRLISTGEEELVEGNTWRDTFWGVCNGVGENHLGKILMNIREELFKILQVAAMSA